MFFDPFQSNLPVTEILKQVKEQLSQGNTLIVNAPPGAGKSTLLPLAMIDESWLQNKKIIMLEPRRLATRNIAFRMASMLQEEPGLTVGYRIRFESRVSYKTRLEVVTEGILTRMLQDDNALENVGLVIFDEFHERNLNADLALALCREAQSILRPDLRILIMSATLNMPQLSALLSAPAIVSEGKQYPVEIVYTAEADETFLPELTARTVIRAVTEKEGDALVFLPGEGEIKKCEAILKEHIKGFSIHPLYGQLPNRDQNLAIVPDAAGKRKIVLATSIAETSLTIEGVRIVVDSGFRRVSRFDPKSSLSRLETVRISKDSADQRAGRAGRLSSGTCYRMWTLATQARMEDHKVPEILESDLCDLMLDLAQWGVDDIQKLTWLTLPPKAAVVRAVETLHQINALENNKITEHGKNIHRLACHPRIAHMLLMAEDLADKQLASDIAAIVEERDPLTKDSGVDINLRIESLRRARRQNNLNNRFSRIEKVAASYRQMLELEINNDPPDAFEAGLLLAFAYPERIASARPGNNAQFQLANGRIADIGQKDDLAHEPWISVANMDQREGVGKIFLAAPLNPKDLATLVKEHDVVAWDTRKGGLIAATELRIGNLVLQSKPLNKLSEDQCVSAISKAIEQEGQTLLDFNEEMIRLQNRISSLRVWNPNEQWPDVSTVELLADNKKWIGPYLINIKRTEDLKKINLSKALLHSLDWELQQTLNALAPETVEVPSGSKIKLNYFANGASPVLSVRLQEVFGLSDTPKVNNGKVAVVMHLLSPGYKAVQVTSDLSSFWNNLYFEVKKELQRRYPKHAWPDDPLNAKAVAKGRSYNK